MKLKIKSYSQQANKLPKTGHYIVAQYDDKSIVVYQAYRSAIGHFAANNGYFDEGFSFDRMSWIKPNFLWMMYRSGWGTKPGQEVTLAVKLKRNAFDVILAEAVHSKFVPNLYETEKEWKKALANSSVRLQWDPDRHPNGAKLERRAIQLGLRGEFLRTYARDWILDIEDISSFVKQQSQNRIIDTENLNIPSESVYTVNDPEIVKKLDLTAS